MSLHCILASKGQGCALLIPFGCTGSVGCNQALKTVRKLMFHMCESESSGIHVVVVIKIFLFFDTEDHKTSKFRANKCIWKY